MASNVLQKEFYLELFHIIGLQEKKNKIERLSLLKRNEGSLLENTISVLKNCTTFQLSENQLFTTALELCNIWICRIIFLKQLEAQLLKYEQLSKSSKLLESFAVEFLNINEIQNFTELNELFFNVIPIQFNKREEKFKQKYPQIPHVNNSLFEQNQLEKDTICINQLIDNKELPVLHSTITKPTLQYLFEFLDNDNFAGLSDCDNKTKINSSVLGLIFEKLNAYRDGSFFTPSYITTYICRDTIRKAIVQKFNVSSLADVVKNISTEKANEIVNSIRICDPAVGTGHFLVSALNELIVIKSELGILTDKNGKVLQNMNCEVQKNELIISYKNNHLNISEIQHIQESIFIEKQKLIENCLFGMDINPNSVSICQLRLWIELMKNVKNLSVSARPDSVKTNIKCGNALIENGNFTDFDVIIGNPPYIYSRNQNFTDSEKKHYQQNYKLQSNQLNTFSLFLEKAFSLSTKTGHVCFIVPNNLLTINSFAKLRKYILENSGDILIINILNQVFVKAVVNTCIIGFCKSKNSKLTIAEFENETVQKSYLVNKEEIKSLEYIFQIQSQKNNFHNKIIKKIERKAVALKEVATVSTGLKVYQTGKGKPPQTDDVKKNRKFHSQKPDNDNFGKYLEGKDVGRYLLKWSGEYLNYGKWIAEPRKSVPFSGDRLLVRQIPSPMPYSVNAVYTDEPFFNDINSMVIFKAKKLDLKYILAIINSKLISFWFQNRYDKLQRNLFPQFKVNELANFPIVDIDTKNDKYLKIITLVDEIINFRKQNPNSDVEQFNILIDNLVYEIFEISQDEITIIHK